MARSCSPHRKPHHGPQPGADRERRTEPGDNGHAQDGPRCGLRRMRRGWPVAVNMHVPMIMAVGVGIGWNHGKVLYYNITGVYRGCRRPVTALACSRPNLQVARPRITNRCEAAVFYGVLT